MTGFGNGGNSCEPKNARIAAPEAGKHKNMDSPLEPQDTEDTYPGFGPV